MTMIILYVYIIGI